MQGLGLRKKLIAGNWKMHGSAALVSELFAALRPELERTNCEIALCPPFPLIPAIRETVQSLLADRRLQMPPTYAWPSMPV